MMICEHCKQPCDGIKTIMRQDFLYMGCESCLPSQLQQGNSAKYYRETQKRDFRRELTQPWQPEFAKAYPELAKEEWGEETFRKYA